MVSPEQLGNYALLASGIMGTTFCLWFPLAANWRHRLAPAIMLLFTAVTLVSDLSVIRWLTGSHIGGGWFAWVRGITLWLVPIAVGMFLYYLWDYRRKRPE